MTDEKKTQHEQEQNSMPTTTTKARRRKKRIMDVRWILSAFKTINWHRYANFEHFVLFRLAPDPPSAVADKFRCAHFAVMPRCVKMMMLPFWISRTEPTRWQRQYDMRRTHRSGNYSLSLTRNSFNYFISLNCSRSEKFSFSDKTLLPSFTDFACVFDNFLLRFFFTCSFSKKWRRRESEERRGGRQTSWAGEREREI